MKSLWKVSLATTMEAEELVCELLGNLLAATPSSWTDAESGVTTVSAYCNRKPADWPEKLTALRRMLGELRAEGVNLGTGRLTTGTLRNEDWADSWKRHFPPIEISHKLLVVPSWSRRAARPGQVVVILDPGLGFGTGKHATTEYCLREVALRRHAGQPQSFLDIGTGSGILAIAATKLGYAPVDAIDCDALSVRIAKKNAQANRVMRRIHIREADLRKLPRRGTRYDFVCANLLADLLVAEHGRLIARLGRGGILVAAGILAREFAAVRRCFEAAGLRFVSSRQKDGWRSGTFRRS